MTGSNFASRADLPTGIIAHFLGIAYNHGPEWTEQRRFALKTLRDFGFGKKSMEAIMHENVDELMDYFR